ncbi:hypothetical protein LCM08_00515 [Salipiger pacificus]|nr:hypothetical protein [Alloyangia pacifica]
MSKKKGPTINPESSARLTGDQVLDALGLPEESVDLSQPVEWPKAGSVAAKLFREFADVIQREAEVAQAVEEQKQQKWLS